MDLFLPSSAVEGPVSRRAFFERGGYRVGSVSERGGCLGCLRGAVRWVGRSSILLSLRLAMGGHRALFVDVGPYVDAGTRVFSCR